MRGNYWRIGLIDETVRQMEKDGLIVILQEIPLKYELTEKGLKAAADLLKQQTEGIEIDINRTKED